jgi:DNA-binding transcriptional LysR family regulator
MEIKTLRSFLAVAREGNVTRAARSLHITQPALSRQLAELERELGCELLVREARGVTLTDQGVLLRKRAEEIVSLADRTELEVRTPAAQVEGDVWVGGGESQVVGLIAEVAAQLAVKHPGIHLHLYSGNGNDVLERVDKGLLDFGLVMGNEPDSVHDAIKMPWTDHWGLLLRRDDPLANRPSLTLDDLRERRLIVSSQSTAGSSSTSSFFEEEGFEVVATYTLLFNASLLVERGVGVAVCLDGIVRTGEGTPFAFVPIAGLPTVGSRLLWKRFQPLSRACEVFLRTLRKQCDEAEASDA